MTVRPPWPERVRVYRGRTIHAARTTRRYPGRLTHDSREDPIAETDTACGRDVRLDDGDRALPDTTPVTCRACQAAQARKESR